MRRTLSVSLLLASLPLLTGCDRSSGAHETDAAEASRTWPDGTVLAIDEQVITAAEVDAAASWIAHIEPAAALPRLRRVALTNVVLARVVVANRFPAERAKARELAEHYRSLAISGELPKGPLVGPMIREVTGSYETLGVSLWGAAMDVDFDEWSEVFESVGKFHLVRRVGTGEGRTELALEFLEFPFVPDDFDDHRVDEAIDRSRLAIVDPEWADCVPIAWQHRMRGGEEP